MSDEKGHYGDKELGWDTIYGKSPEEFVKCDLAAIVGQLIRCEFESEGGILADNVAFRELMDIASDKHKIAACLAKYFMEYPDIYRSIMYIDDRDIGKPIPHGKAVRNDGTVIYGERVIRVTVDYAPVIETEREPVNIKPENIKEIETYEESEQV